MTLDHNTNATDELPRYMVIERFHNNAKDKIYQRFKAKGRMLPKGLHYIDSWLCTDTNLCFQLMATDDYRLFDKWFQHWNDLTDFEVYPIDAKPVISKQP